MRSGCGHDHGGDKLQALVCDVARDLRQIPGAGPVAVIILRDGDPACATITNSSNAAIMAAAICELATRTHKPSDCEACNDAADRMRQALEILKSPLKC